MPGDEILYFVSLTFVNEKEREEEEGEEKAESKES